MADRLEDDIVPAGEGGSIAMTSKFDFIDDRIASAALFDPEVPPILEFQGPYRYLSNFTDVPVTLYGVEYRSTETAYQAGKAVVIDGDPEFMDLRRRMAGLSSLQAKAWGRKIPARADLAEARIPTMARLIDQKYDQEPFRSWLLGTGMRKIVEGNSWGDRFFGVTDRGLGEGENWLGRLTMRKRAIERERERNPSFDVPRIELPDPVLPPGDPADVRRRIAIAHIGIIKMLGQERERAAELKLLRGYSGGGLLDGLSNTSSQKRPIRAQMAWSYDANARPGWEARSTFEAVVGRLRWSTTRFPAWPGFDQWRHAKPGDTVEFFADKSMRGPSVNVAILGSRMIDLAKVPPDELEAWSRVEGWSVGFGKDLGKKYGAGLQVFYQVVDPRWPAPQGRVRPPEVSAAIGEGSVGPGMAIGASSPAGLASLPDREAVRALAGVFVAASNEGLAGRLKAIEEKWAADLRAAMRAVGELVLETGIARRDSAGKWGVSLPHVARLRADKAQAFLGAKSRVEQVLDQPASKTGLDRIGFRGFEPAPARPGQTKVAAGSMEI